jgi:hypothetical protein
MQATGSVQTGVSASRKRELTARFVPPIEQGQQLVGMETQSESPAQARVGSTGAQYDGQGARMHITVLQAEPVGQLPARHSARHSVPLQARVSPKRPGSS